MLKAVLASLLLVSGNAFADESVGLEISIFQGFHSAGSVRQDSQVVVYLPPNPGWSPLVMRQREQLREALGLEGAGLVAGKRVNVASGAVEIVEAMRGRVVASIRPRRTGARLVELDVTIKTGDEPRVAHASASLAGLTGTTFVVGARNAAVPEGWATDDSAVFVAITPLDRLSDPSVWIVEGDVLGPTEVSRVRAVYPPEAKQAGKTGTVVIDVIVDATGAIAWAEIVHHAGPDLDEAALAAVHQWRYSPATRLGKPVPVWQSVTVRFKPS